MLRRTSTSQSKTQLTSSEVKQSNYYYNIPVAYRLTLPTASVESD